MGDMSEMITVSELYDLKETIASELLKEVTYPWEALPKIQDLRRARRAYLGCEKRQSSAYGMPERTSDCR